MCSVITSLTALYESSGQHHYGASQAGSDLVSDVAASGAGDGPDGVSFLCHALQCAAAAERAHPDDDELITAALLHDVGWLLPRPAEGELLTAAPGTQGSAQQVFIARHDATGSAHLRALGFPPRVCALVAGHVAAKRYLVATEPSYAAALSPGSVWTLAQQGGAMSAAEAAAFAADALAPLCLALRRWDEAAKVPGLATAPWAAHVPRLARVLRSAAAAGSAALWASFASPALPDGLQLDAVAPQAAASPLGASGPGYTVVRGWLSAGELAALRAYAGAIPALPAADVFHTYERNGEGATVPSRTERFAHLPDADGVGAFLREGRLRELCSALREGRPMALYKEKINYKLKGKTGGYLPHVDFYSTINAQTLRRELLLDDADVCVCMLAIDDMDEENGCPFVAPGQHAKGPQFFKGAVESLSYGDREFAESVPLVDPAALRWEPVALRAGDVLIYGNNMPHYSRANESARDRRALFAVYTDARHGDLRGLYYAAEAEGRRRAGSARERGKANGFFTGEAVLVEAGEEGRGEAPGDDRRA